MTTRLCLATAALLCLGACTGQQGGWTGYQPEPEASQPATLSGRPDHRIIAVESTVRRLRAEVERLTRKIDSLEASSGRAPHAEAAPSARAQFARSVRSSDSADSGGLKRSFASCPPGEVASGAEIDTDGKSITRFYLDCSTLAPRS